MSAKPPGCDSAVLARLPCAQKRWGLSCPDEGFEPQRHTRAHLGLSASKPCTVPAVPQSPADVQGNRTPGAQVPFKREVSWGGERPQTVPVTGAEVRGQRVVVMRQEGGEGFVQSSDKSTLTPSAPHTTCSPHPHPNPSPNPSSSCSITKLCRTPCDPMGCSTPGFPVLHYLPELAQIHIHWVGDALQPSQPLSSPSPPALNPSQLQGLCQ